MISPSELSTWVTRVFESWNETGIPVSRGVSWMQNNLFRLNASLSSGFYLSGDYIVPEMDQNVSGVYEELYYCDYLRKQANGAVGAHAYDWTEMDGGTDQGSIRRVSRNEVAKNYMTMSRDCSERLQLLIDWYIDTTHNFGSASQVLYGDRGTVADFGLLNYGSPPSCYYSDTNTIWVNE